MASVAMLSAPIKKDANVLARPCLFPKRKPVVSGVATRARFVKPRPNVSVNKASKESSSLPSENTKIDDVPSQPVETESEPLEKPTEPKRAPVPALSRARFQRAKPNISSLLNKSAKNPQSSEDKSAPSSGDTKIPEALDSKLDVSNTPTTESVAEEKCVSEDKSSSVTGSLNMDKVVDMPHSVAESQHSPQSTIDLDSICDNHQESSSTRNVPEHEAQESQAEISSNSAVSITEPANEISLDNTEGSLTSPRASTQATPEKESPTAVNKSMEYPTLKSILNSPRKRTTTKKAHERRKRVANFSSTPSRSEMTMVDLIYWNPSSSPMKEVKPVAPAEEDLLPVDDPPPSVEEPESCNIGPKVIINDDGEIILDESSLFVRRKDTVDHSKAAVVENDNTTYSSFRNRSFKTWSKRETAKFYKALSLVGTDFALMEGIFKEDGKVTRSRRELKLKFKREEKSNPKLVHTAIYELQTYDLNIDEDQDIALLDESEIIDDAPKQVKKSAAPGTKAPGKRARKKKSDLTEVGNKSTSESLPVAEEESREASNSMCSVDLQGNKDKEIDSNPLPATLRPGRARKARILSDYVTDVDDLSDPSDYLETEEETLPIKKRKRPQVLSEEEDVAAEVIDSNGSIVNGVDPHQEKASIEEIYPFTADERNGLETETNSGTVPIKKRRMFQRLPKTNEENDEIPNSVSELLIETSRSGRKIKAKKMSDFITLGDSEDDMIPGEEMEELEEVAIISYEENAEISKPVKSTSRLCNSTQPEEEFSVIPASEADGEYPGEQSVILTLDVEKRNGNNTILEASDAMDQIVLNSPELISVAEIIPSSTEVVSTTVSSDKPKTDNLTQLPDSKACNIVNENNILIDPAVAEVVVTSDQAPRRTRRKALPNVARGSKRPPIQRKPPPPPRRTTFTSFTPVEETPAIPQVDDKLNFVQSSKTYSRQTLSTLIESQDPDNVEYLETVPELEYLETVQKSPLNIVRKRSLSGPAKSPSTQEMNISRTNSMCSPIRSPLANASLNVLDFKSDSTPPHSSTELPLHALTADPKAINMNPENSTDSVVFLTRTPNNSNMLHLFVYQKS